MQYVCPLGGCRSAGFYCRNSEEKTLIIDAGHGGEDGGAVSLSGVPESGLNLSIALKLDQLLGLCGYAPVLLRTQDVSLGTQGDTRYLRVRPLISAAGGAGGGRGKRGAHQHPPEYLSTGPVFRCPGVLRGYPGSQEFAKLTQEIHRQALNPQNNRQAKEIPDTVYLMNHITCPAILVECGFLSNPEEEQLLISGRLSDQDRPVPNRLLAGNGPDGGGGNDEYTGGGIAPDMKAKTLFYWHRMWK